MTNSARLSGRPSSSAAYNVGDVVDTPDSAIKSWRYLGAGEWEPNDAVRYTTSPGGGNRLSVAGARFYPLNPRWWSAVQPQAIRRPLITPGLDGSPTPELYSAQGGAMTTVEAADQTFGRHALELTCPEGGGATKAAGADVLIDADLTLDDVIVLHMYVPSDIGAYYNISVWLYQTGKTNARSATFETSSIIMMPGVGRVAFARRLSEFTGGTGPLPADAAAYQNYKWLRVQANATAGGAAARIQLLHVEVLRKRRPMVVLTCDDNQLNQKTVGAPIFQSYGIPMTLFCMTNSPSSGSAEHMTWADLRWMSSRGHVVCNHTTSHLRAEAAYASPAQWAADVERARDALIAQGFADGASHFAWCNGVRSAPYIAEARRIGLLTARSLNSRGVHGTHGIPTPLDMPSVLQTGKTAAQILSEVDLETARGGDCVITTHFFHETTHDGQTMSRAEATALAKGLRERAEAGTIIIGTVPELWARRQAEAGWSPEI